MEDVVIRGGETKPDTQQDSGILDAESIALDYSPHQTRLIASSTTVRAVGWLPQVCTRRASCLT
jgi:hypothetical protein